MLYPPCFICCTLIVSSTITIHTHASQKYRRCEYSTNTKAKDIGPRKQQPPTIFASDPSLEVVHRRRLPGLEASIRSNTILSSSEHASVPSRQGGTIRTGNWRHHTQPFRHVRVDDNNNMGCCPLHRVEHPLLLHPHRTLQREPDEQPPACGEQEQEKAHVVGIEESGARVHWVQVLVSLASY